MSLVEPTLLEKSRYNSDNAIYKDMLTKKKI